LVPPVGTVLGLGASIVDSFVIERLFPMSGPLSFVNNMLPSAFEMSDRKRKRRLEPHQSS